jgi:hypothetical protein
MTIELMPPTSNQASPHELLFCGVSKAPTSQNSANTFPEMCLVPLAVPGKITRVQGGQPGWISI